MKQTRLSAVLLATILQIVPLSKEAVLLRALMPSGFAVLFRCAGLAAALLGEFNAVSGASAAVAGLANINPLGPVTTNATGTVGGNFGYRIIVTNPGSDHLLDYYNAEPLPPGLTINTNLGGNGKITGIPAQQGVFRVKLTAGNANYDGAVHKDVTISIAGNGSPPGIATQPASQTVLAGQPVDLTVVASGQGPFSYQWQRDGAPLAGATNSTYSIVQAASGDAGIYMVVVSNPSGSTPSLPATLLVQLPVVPPSIQVQPTNLSLLVGEAAAFTVVAEGTAPLTFQWTKDGAELTGATNATFAISSIGLTDAGSYIVKVGNSAGTAASDPAVLKVESPPAQDLVLTEPGVTNDVFHLVVVGPAPAEYVIWCSRDMVSWMSLSTNLCTDGTLVYTDPGASSNPASFYRATLVQ